MFENIRRRNSRKKKNKQEKVITYVQDIILVSMNYKSRSGEIAIPRATKRNKLGKAGLVGKIEIESTMTDAELRQEICEVFAEPMGLSEEDMKSGHCFPFTYLQKAGAGARYLCIPSVKESFKWNGKQVASLAKSGSFIYLLAEAELPAYECMVS